VTDDTPDVSEFDQLERHDELKRAYVRLQRKLAKDRQGREDLVNAVQQAARDAWFALGPMPPVPKPKPAARKGRPEVALWHLTDWQGGKQTTTYNTSIMKARILHFVDVAEHITFEARSAHPVDECCILFGGDLIEGLLNFPQQPFQVDSSYFAQLAFASRLMVEVVRRALAIYSTVKVIGEWGNHGRIGTKRDAVPSSDNFDRMILWHAYEMLSADPSIKDRLVWQAGPDGTQPVEIGNYRAILCHGDEFGRTGHVSRATFVKKVTQWKSGAYKRDGEHWPFRDAYVGHYHTHNEDSLPDGEGAVYWSGSPESDNAYAHDGLAAGATPSQRFHMIDPVEGRVASQRKIWLPV
jgi:hypothetical protein